jgi:hypothetical protein
MRSNDDDMYDATVRQTPRSWWSGKLKASDEKRNSRRKRNLKHLAPIQNVWAPPGRDDLR